jgi:hypothetical protein
MRHQEKIGGSNLFNQSHSDGKKQRAFEHLKHVHKIPSAARALQKLKKAETYYRHLKNGKRVPTSDLGPWLVHQIEHVFEHI